MTEQMMTSAPMTMTEPATVRVPFTRLSGLMLLGWCEGPNRGSGLLDWWLSIQRARIAWKHLPPSVRTGRILDIGCGRSAWFLQTIDATEKIGLEPLCSDDEYVATRDGVSHRMRLLPFDVTKEPLQFESNWFDVVVALAVIEHVPAASAVRLLQEIHRVLKPGGSCVVTTPAHGTEIILHTIAKLRLASHEEIEEHHQQFTPRQLRALFLKAGFEDRDIIQGRFELGMNLWLRANKAAHGQAAAGRGDSHNTGT